MIPINEIFATIQGEASHTGTPAVFIRTQGCNVGCGWCDTKHTWQLEEADQSLTLSKMHEKPQNWKPMHEDEIVGHVRRLAGPNIWHVVISGGEPLMHDLSNLVSQLLDNEFTVQIETSGTEPLPTYAELCWITCSPKFDMPGNMQVIQNTLTNANEIKLPVGKMKDIERFDSAVENLPDFSLPPIFLQPLSLSRKATELCVTECMKRGWYLSPQTHKFVNIP